MIVLHLPYVKVGKVGPLAHATWQGAVMEPGLPGMIELAGVIRRYHSPLYRTVIYKPSEEQRRMAIAVRQSHEAGTAEMRAGRTSHQVYEAFHSVLADAGFGDLHRHRNGYSVGIAFPPNWVQRIGLDIMKSNQMVIEPGMVFHTPTSLYIMGKYAIAQSNTVLVTEGEPEALTGAAENGPYLYD